MDSVTVVVIPNKAGGKQYTALYTKALFWLCKQMTVNTMKQIMSDKTKFFFKFSVEIRHINNVVH
jgi:hypothetical protein